MTDDNRCCGTGTCIIDDDGRCWCGQVWDGEKMCFQPSSPAASVVTAQTPEPPAAE
ncbi:MAG: hypothetical protein ACOVLL_01505 [Hydrogenophaga sp.]